MFSALISVAFFTGVIWARPGPKKEPLGTIGAHIYRPNALPIAQSTIEALKNPNHRLDVILS